MPVCAQATPDPPRVVLWEQGFGEQGRDVTLVCAIAVCNKLFSCSDPENSCVSASIYESVTS